MDPAGVSRRLLVAAALGLAAWTLAAGCGAATGTSGPSGDAGGNHLVVFSSDRGGGNTFRLYVYDLDELGFRNRSLTQGVVVSANAEPCLSSDAGFIAYATPTATAGDTDVVIYDRLNARVISAPGLNSARSETWPRFSDDGFSLTFVRDTTGGRRIRLYESRGDTLIPLPGIDSPGAANDDQPSPNVNGSVIAFTSDRTGKRHVYVWDRTTGSLRATPSLVGDDDDLEPSLSPDGRWLAFSTKRTGGAGGWDVALYDLTAGALVPLPRLNSSDDERHPSVSRDGMVIAYASNQPTTNGGASEVFFYFRSDSTVRIPSGLPSSGDDRQPFLRWR